MAAKTVSIEARNLSGAIMKLENLQNITLPKYTKRGHNRTAEILTKSLKKNMPKWKGTAASATTAVPLSKESIAIKMPFYMRFVEGGTLPHAVSAKNVKLRAWWQDKGGKFSTFDALRMAIERKGTRPNPFIERSIDEAKPDIDRELESVAALAIKEAGFRR